MKTASLTYNSLFTKLFCAVKFPSCHTHRIQCIKPWMVLRIHPLLIQFRVPGRLERSLHQSFTGLSHKDRQLFTHAGNLESPPAVIQPHACHWTARGSWSTWREPIKTWVLSNISRFGFGIGNFFGSLLKKTNLTYTVGVNKNLALFIK